MTIDDIKAYFQFRGQTWPDGFSALLFAVTEVGEAVDAHLRSDPKWKRNNQKVVNLGHELGDIYQMLQIASVELTGKTVEQNLAEKWQEKGYFIPDQLPVDHLMPEFEDEILPMS